MKKYYVYVLIDPRTNQPFYVGKGSGDRMYTHVREAMNRSSDINEPKLAFIRAIIEDGYTVTHQIVEWFDDNKFALACERDYITKYGRLDLGTGPLFNRKTGDEKPRKQAKPIYQFTVAGTLIAKHKSCYDACIALGLDPVSGSVTIGSAANGKISSSSGFLWSRNPSAPPPPKTAVYQWTVDGVLVDVHLNEGYASRQIGAAQAQVHSAVVGTSRTCKGFVLSKSCTFPGVRESKATTEAAHTARKRKVVHVNTNVVYETVTQAANATHHNVGAVSAVCLGKREHISGDVFQYC